VRNQNVNRRGRLLVPLALAALFWVLHFLIAHNTELIARLAKTQKSFNPKAFHESIENITLFLVFVPLIFFVVRLVDFIAFDFASKRRKVHAPVLLRQIVSIVLFVMLVVGALTAIFNTNITGVLATGTVLAAVLGLALQETLGNLFAGIALHLDDSFEVGDVIKSGEVIGVVESVGWRGTHLRSFANTIVIVPNSDLAKNRVEVFPRNNLNARVLQFGVDYNVPPATALNVLSQAASNVDGVSTQVPAFARVGGFGESSVLYEVKYHTVDYSQRDRIDADIRKAVWYALRRNDIPIPYPIRTHVRYQPPVSRHHPDRAEIAERLAQIDILSPLPPESRESIANAARIHAYAKGETIIRQGSAGSSMFIVHDGVVSIRVNDNELARLGAGDFFGEMALLTGEARAADVVACNEVVAVEITRQAVEPVLHAHTELASAISAKVAERRGGIESLKTGTGEDAQRTVLSRIRSYFGL
jgi:small-conductance mechanosensitive channel/CRP-like cAMP-binding protein